MSELDKFLGLLSQRFSIIREMLAVEVMEVKFSDGLCLNRKLFFEPPKDRRRMRLSKNKYSLTLFWSLLSAFFLT
jgi:hypothetical protein